MEVNDLYRATKEGFDIAEGCFDVIFSDLADAKKEIKTLKSANKALKTDVFWLGFGAVLALIYAKKEKKKLQDRVNILGAQVENLRIMSNLHDKSENVF